MLDNVRLTHKIWILPILSALGFIVVFAILLNGQTRAVEIRSSARTDELRQIVAGVASAAQLTSAGAATTLEAAVRLGQTASDLETTLNHFKFHPSEER